jgi:hypothetical protein
MSGNQYDKDMEYHGEYIVDIINKYDEYERHRDIYESTLDETGNKVKAGTKAVFNKVKVTDKNIGSEHDKEKQNSLDKNKRV